MTALATRARLTAAAVIACLMMIAGAAAPAWADSTDDLTKIDQALTAAVEDFMTVYIGASSRLEEVAEAAQTFSASAKSAQSDFSAAAESSSDVTTAKYAKDFAVEAGNMASAVSMLATGFASRDESAVQQGESDLHAALDRYGALAHEYNGSLQTIGGPAFIGWLIVLIVAVVLMVVALIFALVTRQQGLLRPKTDKKGNVTQSSLKKMRWIVVGWAAVFVVGAAIPFFQVMFTKPDSTGQYTYRVFWYPLGAGVVLTIISIVQYFVSASRVRRHGSAVAYDPADPATHAQPVHGDGYTPVPPADGAAQQHAPGVPAAGAPVPPAEVPFAPTDPQGTIRSD